MGRRERNIDLAEPPTAEELAKLRGIANRNEPTLIQTMRGEMRVLHYSAATERAYVRWVKRFSAHVGSMELEQFDELDIGTLLKSLRTECPIPCVTVSRPTLWKMERTFRRYRS